jgi:DnaD/phage-associated family protein
MNTVLFWHEQLHFSTELIVYLLEYCISKGHTSMRYMDKVALGWHEKGIRSVEQAKEDAAIHSQAYYGVMKAFGITGRSLVETEKSFIRKWTKEYQFDLPLIQEACSRTMTATHQPSFEYTDSILTSWHKNHVHTLADIQKLDSAYSKSKKSSVKAAPAARKNSFTNFSARDYDYDHLEELLLSSSAH